LSSLKAVELACDSLVRRPIISADVTVLRGAASQTRARADRTAVPQLLVAHFGLDLPEAERLRVPTVAEWS
jgi:hypothetical protein